MILSLYDAVKDSSHGNRRPAGPARENGSRRRLENPCVPERLLSRWPWPWRWRRWAAAAAVEAVGARAKGAEARTCARRDRKSTRLNSSHANISYAVFCLKKKNTPFIL